jgi:hypothetical protein
VNSNGAVYVVDRGNHQVQQWFKGTILHFFFILKIFFYLIEGFSYGKTVAGTTVSVD